MYPLVWKQKCIPFKNEKIVEYHNDMQQRQPGDVQTVRFPMDTPSVNQSGFSARNSGLKDIKKRLRQNISNCVEVLLIM